MAKALALKKFAEEECPWRQHIGIYGVGESGRAKTPVARRKRWALPSPVTTTVPHVLLLLAPERNDLRQKTPEPAQQIEQHRRPPNSRKEEGFSHKTRP